MKGRILMLLNGYYPSDIRVLKEARVLMNAGYKLTLCCLNRGNESPSEIIEGLEVVRIRYSGKTWQQGLLDIGLAMFRKHPLFWVAIKKLQKEIEFDLIHIHDLPLFFTAKSAFRGKVVLDLHENYPDALSVWFKWRRNPFIRIKNKLFFGLKRWRKYEIDAVKSADRVIAVVDEMKERLEMQANFPSDKIAIVSNMEDKTFLNQEVDERIFEQHKGKFIVTYTGNVGPHRGVDTLVKAMTRLKANGDIIGLIIGTCSDSTKAYLEGLIEEGGISGKVEIWGHRPFNQFYSFMNMSDVNIIPHNKSEHTDHTIPHKLFQAMMVGKPVIVSSCKPLKRYVSKYNSGLIFDAEDPEDLAKQILALYHDRNLCRELGENGTKATVDGDLNWDNEGRKLVDFYQQMGV